MDGWGATDPITLHKYLYANDNPVKYVDPSGNFSIGGVGAANAGFAALAAMAGTYGLKALSLDGPSSDFDRAK